MIIYTIFLVLFIANFTAFFIHAAMGNVYIGSEAGILSGMWSLLKLLIAVPTGLCLFIPNLILAWIARLVLWTFYCLCMMTVIRDYSIVGIDSVKE